METLEDVKQLKCGTKILYVMSGSWYPSRVFGEITNTLIKENKIDYFIGAYKGDALQSSRTALGEITDFVEKKLLMNPESITDINSANKLFRDLLKKCEEFTNS